LYPTLSFSSESHLIFFSFLYCVWLFLLLTAIIYQFLHNNFISFLMSSGSSMTCSNLISSFYHVFKSYFIFLPCVQILFHLFTIASSGIFDIWRRK
jgi:hypothetical protein